ncbi:zinc-ribbon domain-containing protein [Gemmatimonas sp.]|uniref:zinc-ribbon domain-containing protein n=1 Tax=Gemmatimonas sp. TaxID=1962908 RepID=UPI003562092E
MSNHRRCKGAVPITTHPVAGRNPPRTPFTPHNIYIGESARWFHDGVDVSDRLVWWRCQSGHEYQASIACRIAGSGCEMCDANT